MSVTLATEACDIRKARDGGKDRKEGKDGEETRDTEGNTEDLRFETLDYRTVSSDPRSCVWGIQSSEVSVAAVLFTSQFMNFYPFCLVLSAGCCFFSFFCAAQKPPVNQTACPAVSSSTFRSFCRCCSPLHSLFQTRQTSPRLSACLNGDG